MVSIFESTSWTKIFTMIQPSHLLLVTGRKKGKRTKKLGHPTKASTLNQNQSACFLIHLIEYWTKHYLDNKFAFPTQEEDQE